MEVADVEVALEQWFLEAGCRDLNLLMQEPLQCLKHISWPAGVGFTLSLSLSELDSPYELCAPSALAKVHYLCLLWSLSSGLCLLWSLHKLPSGDLPGCDMENSTKDGYNDPLVPLCLCSGAEGRLLHKRLDPSSCLRHQSNMAGIWPRHVWDVFQLHLGFLGSWKILFKSVFLATLWIQAFEMTSMIPGNSLDISFWKWQTWAWLDIKKKIKPRDMSERTFLSSGRLRQQTQHLP